jgi:long-chain acyl-CoA synthetase
MAPASIATLSDLVFHVRGQSAGRPSLLATKRGGRLVTLSTADLITSVHSLALAMEAHGLEKGQRVAIWSENCPEWHVVDLACHLLGAVVVPIYPTVNAEQLAFILKNSGVRWVFFSDVRKLEVLARTRSSFARPPIEVAIEEEARGDGLSLVRLQGEGAPEAAAMPFERMRDRVAPDDLASLIYTSGTTGEPKGVMLSHHNFVSNVLACSELFELGPADEALSFLPLSHVFERTVDYLFFYRGVAIHYAPSIERVPHLLQEIRPTVVASVPRLYERAYLRIQGNLAREKKRTQKIFGWAVDVGKRQRRARDRGFVPPTLALQRAVAQRLVYRKIQERFGGRLRFAISGGAPINPDVAELFDAVGVRLFQGYGLTESAPVIAAESFGTQRKGSVGKPIPGVELRIAEDGEILVRSPGVMRGYWENPMATAEVLDAQGWLHTGDVGHLDRDGYLFITDRKKDILITSGGKNVAPQPIEARLIAHRVIGQAVVVGDRYPYLTALLYPRTEELPENLQELAREELLVHESLHRLVKIAIDEINQLLAEHERIRNWRLLPRELTQEAGEITPSLKVRRRIVLERFQELVESMYLKTQKIG